MKRQVIKGALGADRNDRVATLDKGVHTANRGPKVHHIQAPGQGRRQCHTGQTHPNDLTLLFYFGAGRGVGQHNFHQPLALLTPAEINVIHPSLDRGRHGHRFCLGRHHNVPAKGDQ